MIQHYRSPEGEYPLRDVAEPVLFREIFPYSAVPQARFDRKLVPISPAERFLISDTTFRDGQQARAPYTLKQIVDLFRLLNRLGGTQGVIRHSEFFLYSERDRRAVEEVLALGFEYPEVTGWIRADLRDLKLVREAGLKETGILTSCSDYHIFLKLGKRRGQVLEDYLSVVKEALSAGLRIRCHLEDITRADVYGFVVPFAVRLMRLREESKIDVRLRLCDTLGYGLPYPEAALPRGVPRLVRALIDDAGVPGELLEWHGHNDLHKGLVNATAAWLYGCAMANGTLLGKGERTGNTPVEALIIEYIALTGRSAGIDTTAITDIANYYEQEIGEQIPSNYPLVGSDFNATAAGIHADGLAKNAEIYNLFDTEKILRRPPAVFINDKSGAAGIAQWVNTHLRLTGERRVDKRDPLVTRVKDWVDELYAQGRITSIANEEMEHAVRRFMPHLFVSEFDRIKRRALEMAEDLIRQTAERADIRSLDPQAMAPVLRKLVLENRFIQFAYVTDLGARIITPFVTQPSLSNRYRTAPLPDNFADRTWFQKPLEDGKIHVTEFYVSYVTGVLCLTVSAPVFGVDERAAGVLGFDIQFEDLVRADDLRDL